jgi:site-specific recombinase XerD
MTTRTLIPQERGDLARNTILHVEWRQALDTFLNTLSSPRTAQAYQRAVVEAMDAMGVDYVADVTAPMVAEYRGWLVGRLDTERADRLSPATVSLKLAGLRQFLRFCLVTGLIGLSKDAIAFVLKSPKATVEKPYQVLNESERRRLLEVAQESGPGEHALVSLAFGAGLRVSELVKVRLADFSQSDGWNPSRDTG